MMPYLSSQDRRAMTWCGKCFIWNRSLSEKQRPLIVWQSAEEIAGKSKSECVHTEKQCIERTTIKGISREEKK